MWNDLQNRIGMVDPVKAVGRVSNLVGMTIEVKGLSAAVGSLCRIEVGPP